MDKCDLITFTPDCSVTWSWRILIKHSLHKPTNQRVLSYLMAFNWPSIGGSVADKAELYMNT